jgi:phosphopantothenoylcysteine decarboxylase
VLLLAGCRAWDFSKPLLLAPAMNTFMWASPFTEHHLATCRRLGALVSERVAWELWERDIYNIWGSHRRVMHAG